MPSSGAISFYTYNSGNFLEVSGTTFKSNEGDLGGGAIAVYEDSINVHAKVENSTFYKNNFGEGIRNASGAISTHIYDDDQYGELDGVNFASWNNTFLDNSVVKKAVTEIKGGAIGFENNIFENSLIKNLFVGNKLEKDSLAISGTTFSQNKGSGGGGAIVIHESEPAAANMELENNTFFKNSSRSDFDLANGGAILVYNANESEEESITTNKLNSKNNTIFDNKIIRDSMLEIPEDVKGGAIGMKGNFMKHEFMNDLLVGNNVENNENPSKLFSNIYLPSTKFKESNSLGFDNGTETKDTVAQAYGKYPVVLAENGSTVKAGSKEDATVIPTIMIAPRLNGTVGTANMTGGKGTKVDQRGHTRKGKPDIGAVEISSIVYDSNGGNFSLPELTKYDGKTYYEGANADQYAKVGAPDVAFTIIDGKKVLKPTKANYEFIGWTDEKTDKFAKVKYNTGKKVMVDDQTVLYAVWKKKTYSLKYFNNGKTTGTIPTQKNVVPNGSVTIKSQGKLKRKGYKFSGWSTKPSAKKGEAAYAPGKKLKLVKNTKLYAIWKR
ncbi:hypothetical protein KZO01_16010 [Kurthia zopfii]|uniref:Repeat n=1 Tax=Kurthia zopfii TaxID=1650 RepID=A0A2U3ADL5_9BACL|nr:InlB B-repeat-containing protein [Kurthia zopfii]PWI22610.1 hypothetical protein DF281_06660 [Kurthia zopfii]TDR39069.1 putative repeat protein (TIGR02543 family) [Kurthia zopfii]STX09605.1 repeat [Kurthia zopfii]VEI08306.1 repeat [Kurthia zopfii]GEK31292.1 hypothetical protein KZO01_16010 [Kurthia zopfii]